MAQYDGAVRIGTSIDIKDVKKGVFGIRSALKGISPDAKRTKESFDSLTTGARDSTEKLISSVKRLGVIIASAFSVRKIIHFGESAIQAAADMEAMDSQFSQVFGDFERQASQSLSKISNEAGIMEERMKGSYTKIAAFAKTTGMDTASSLELANRAMAAVADSAAFYDRSLEETTESLQSFLKGNYENDAALGLSATEYTRNAAAMKLYGKSFIYLSEAQKQLTLLQMVEDANKLSGAVGQAAREADTWTNQTGNLNQALKNLKANIGKFLLPMAVQAIKMITSVINSINALLSRLYTASGAFRSFSELITGNKSEAGNGFSGITSEGSVEGYNAAAEAAENLADANEDVADSTKKAEKAAKGQLSTLDKLNNITTKEGDSADAGSDFGIVSGSVLPVQEVDYGKLAEGENFADKLADSLINVWDVFRQAWKQNGKRVVSAAKRAFKSLLGVIKNIGQTLQDVFTGETGLEWVESLLGLFESILDIINLISSAFSTAWDSGAGGENVSALFGMLTEINDLLKSIKESFGRAFSGDVGTEIFENVLGIFTGIYNTIGNIATGIQTAWDTAGLGDSIWNGILEIANTILGTIHSITDSTAEWADSLDFTPLLESIDTLLQELQPLTENIGEGLEWFWNNVLLPIAGWTIQDAVPTFLDMLSVAVGTLNTIIDVIKPSFEWFWRNLLEPLGKWAGEAVISAMEEIAGLLEKIGGWISEHKGEISEFITIIGLLAAGFVGVQGAIKLATGVLPSLVKNIKKVIAILTGPLGLVLALAALVTATGHGEEMIESLQEILGGLLDFVVGVFTLDWERAWNGIVSIFEGIGKGIATVLDSILDGITWVLEKIGILNKTEIKPKQAGLAISGGTGIGNLVYPKEVKIPGYATGQVIPRSMRQHLAILGDNNQETEVVSPLSTIKQALREEAVSLGLTGGAGGTQELTIHIPVQINGRTLLDIMKQLDLEEYRRTGRPTFQV